MDFKGYMSKSQKDKIYEEDLVPLKAKIASILLYDTEKAGEFLQRYNDILRTDGEEGINNLISEIIELKNEIEEYEQSEKRQEELFRDQGKVIIQQLEDLQQRQEKLKIEDFEYEFSNIKEIYEQNLLNYSYTDRSNIESYIYSTQAKLIIRKIRDGAIDLYDEIGEKDANGLLAVLNNKIFELIQDENPKVQDIVSEIKYKMIGRTDSVYDPEIWRLLDSAQRIGKDVEETKKIEQKEPIKSSSSLLPVVSANKKRFEFPRLFKKKIKIAGENILLSDTVQIGDRTIKAKELLSKISLDSLASQVPEEMLIEIEEEILKSEIRRSKRENKIPQKRYIPDPRTPIYDSILNSHIVYKINFYDETGMVLQLEEKRYQDYCERTTLTGSDGTEVIRDIHYTNRLLKKVYNIINYAGLIDRIMKSNLKQQLLNEIGRIRAKQILTNEREKFYIKHDFKDDLKSNVEDNIQNNKSEQEVNQTEKNQSEEKGQELGD